MLAENETDREWTSSGAGDCWSSKAIERLVTNILTTRASPATDVYVPAAARGGTD
jgi:hypothetical protein